VLYGCIEGRSGEVESIVSCTAKEREPEELSKGFRGGMPELQ
jgi:hypothetical protein